MTNEEKLALITRTLEETLTEDELKHLITSETPLKHYIGFELSGQLHLGQGLVTMMKIKDFIDAGVECTIFLADWHSWINEKLGGDMQTIQNAGVAYFKEGFIACMRALGGDPTKIHFLTGTQLYEGHLDYWATVIDISKKTTLARMMRTVSIMGRKEGESMDFAKLIYPPMQAADIFFQGVNIAHAGMDQRKAHVIARDCALQIKTHTLHDTHGTQIKPVALHHPLLLGLATPPKWPIPKEELQEVLSDMKMSKSKPQSAVFITDTTEEIRDKLRKAFCPEKEVEYNPVLNWTKQIIFPLRQKFTVTRDEKFGGNLQYATYEALEKDFADGAVHPMDVKAAVAEYLIDILKPVRDHFEQDPAKSVLADLKTVLSR